MVAQCECHTSERFVNPPVTVFIVSDKIMASERKNSFLSNYITETNLVLVINLDLLKDLKCPGAIYQEYSYLGRYYQLEIRQVQSGLL